MGIASVSESIEDMIAAAFYEAYRCDPQRTRQRVFLAGGNEQRVTVIEDQAAEHGPKIPVPIDYIHVSGYIGNAACGFVIEDRFGITGARWSPDGAELILKLGAVVVNGNLGDDMNYYKERYGSEHRHACYDEDTIERLDLAA